MKRNQLTFCRLCFVKLKLLLLSIEAKQGEGGDTKISINPRQNKIAANMVGFFMAQSAEEVKRCVLGHNKYSLKTSTVKICELL